MKKTIADLAACWGLSYDDAERVYDTLSIGQWSASEPIVYAGVIDNDDANKICGHNGFWVADADESVCFVTNSDPVWCEWSEDCANDIGVSWGDFSEEMEGFKLLETLYADTTNGVTKTGDDTYVTEEITDESVFYSSLKDLKDDEYIMCNSISKAMYAKIKKEYGIH